VGGQASNVKSSVAQACRASGMAGISRRQIEGQAASVDCVLYFAAWLRCAYQNILGVYMYEFISDQVLGINGLIKLIEHWFLVAFSVRDLLKLRILAIIDERLTLA
jgi:hypothetical protein